MWTDLTTNQKFQYKEYCDNKYGDTFTFSETGEPLYFDSELNMIDTDIIIDLLFNVNHN